MAAALAAKEAEMSALQAKCFSQAQEVESRSQEVKSLGLQLKAKQAELEETKAAAATATAATVTTTAAASVFGSIGGTADELNGGIGSNGKLLPLPADPPGPPEPSPRVVELEQQLEALTRDVATLAQERESLLGELATSKQVSRSSLEVALAQQETQITAWMEVGWAAKDYMWVVASLGWFTSLVTIFEIQLAVCLLLASRAAILYVCLSAK